ncbi:MAG: ABC transporter permease, partial [Spirochaetaceae bacterium]|nr:ABC transporter permease [Spirochaetaceae bacterium]
MRGSNDFRAGVVLALAVLVLSLVSVFYLPYGYNDMAPENRFLAPGPAHPMGTDNFGRDVFSRIMAGGRYTLTIAVLTVAGAALAGSALGLFSG